MLSPTKETGPKPASIYPLAEQALSVCKTEHNGLIVMLHGDNSRIGIRLNNFSLNTEFDPAFTQISEKFSRLVRYS